MISNPWFLADAFAVVGYAVSTAQHSICQPIANFFGDAMAWFVPKIGIISQP